MRVEQARRCGTRSSGRCTRTSGTPPTRRAPAHATLCLALHSVPCVVRVGCAECVAVMPAARAPRARTLIGPATIKPDSYPLVDLVPPCRSGLMPSASQVACRVLPDALLGRGVWAVAEARLLLPRLPRPRALRVQPRVGPGLSLRASLRVVALPDVLRCVVDFAWVTRQELKEYLGEGAEFAAAYDVTDD
eukprot:3533421-Rhodomonas_salina.2